MTKQVRDWHKDMELVAEAATWEFELTFDGEGNIVKDTQIIAENVGASHAGTIFNAFEALLYWLQQYAAAEAREKKLREALEHCIKEYPQWDSKEIAAGIMLDYMKNVLSIIYPLDKEEEAK
ncbi:hypothetical protein ACFQ3W_24815 [Paenibacillus puldeungensis]|uniref:Uncharacterized protein n=1 Tax=Paenibacillus puldeungensis TaxID=696536 RepID=A0ABW3S3X4_9BACL